MNISNIKIKDILPSELYHHGIKGQKWGVRRFQNEDGTLTEEGKKQYGITDNDIKVAKKYIGLLDKNRYRTPDSKNKDDAISIIKYDRCRGNNTSRYFSDSNNKSVQLIHHFTKNGKVALSYARVPGFGDIYVKGPGDFNDDDLKGWLKKSPDKDKILHVDFDENYLAHFGVKGMKWGVQKAPEESINANSKTRSTAKNSLKIAGGGALGTALGVASVYAGSLAAGAALSAVGMAKMNKDWQHSGKHLDAINRGYDKLKDLFPKLLIGGAVTGAAVGAGIAAKKVYNKNKNKNSDTKNVKHSDFSENDISHSGIKGMKWGIRRYQNEDGTLTDAGKVRYNANGTKKTVEKMTDAELAKANQRLSAEQNYNRLTGRNYKNRPASVDIALKAGISAVGGALLSSGAYILRDLAKNPETKLGKEYFKSNKMKTAGLLGILGASVAAISSTVTSLGGQASIQNIGDQKKK